MIVIEDEIFIDRIKDLLIVTDRLDNWKEIREIKKTCLEIANTSIEDNDLKIKMISTINFY